MSTRTTAQSEGLSSGGAAIGILLSGHVRSGRAGLRYRFDPAELQARVFQRAAEVTPCSPRGDDSNVITSARFVHPQSLCWHERRSALVLDHEHQEFSRLGTARVAV